MMWRPWREKNTAETKTVQENNDLLSGPEEKPHIKKLFSTFKCNQCDFTSKRNFNLERDKNRVHVKKEKTCVSTLRRNIIKLKMTKDPEKLIEYVTAAAVVPAAVPFNAGTSHRTYSYPLVIMNQFIVG